MRGYRLGAIVRWMGKKIKLTSEGGWESEDRDSYWVYNGKDEEGNEVQVYHKDIEESK